MMTQRGRECQIHKGYIVDSSTQTTPGPSAEPAAPVNVLCAYEEPIGAIRNTKAVLEFLAEANPEALTTSKGASLGHWLIMRTAIEALGHVDKIMSGNGKVEVNP